MSVSLFILLSTTPTVTPSDWDPRLLPTIEEAANWIDTSESVEKKAPGEPCNASPSLSYLRSQIKHLLVHDTKYYKKRARYSVDEAVEIFVKQPLLYSFYVQNVFQPYRSQLTKANSTSFFCYLDQKFHKCYNPEDPDCKVTIEVWDTSVCFPNSDRTTEGRCVSCRILEAEINNGTLQNETRISYLNDTCNPKSRAPKRAPLPYSEGLDTRYLRWFLESSFVFEKKKVWDNCSASPELGKARVYVDVLMRKHFGKRNQDGDVDLATPGKERKEDEIAYEAAQADVTQREEFFKEKLKTLIGWDNRKVSFEDVYCSMDEGLVCMDGRCRDCEDENVKWKKDLMEDCNLKEEGRGRSDDGKKKSDGKRKVSSGAQEGRQISKLTMILGICASTIFEMFWW
jgi:hypothetical protein